VDLSERTLEKAGLIQCFELIEGNRFQMKNGRISGMDFKMPNPENKVSFLQKKQISADRAIAIGDGYTDLPMLDWARIPILIDRAGTKKDGFYSKDYHMISSITELLKIVEETKVQ
jgi:phosphoserine phosphatase